VAIGNEGIGQFQRVQAQIQGRAQALDPAAGGVGAQRLARSRRPGGDRGVVAAAQEPQHPARTHLTLLALAAEHRGAARPVAPRTSQARA